MSSETATYQRRKLNMNGRMHRAFQDPTSQQGFNRYAYCFYNPLKYTDPAGERAYGPAWYEIMKAEEEYVKQERYNAYMCGMNNLYYHDTFEMMFFNSICTWGDNGPANTGGGHDTTHSGVGKTKDKDGNMIPDENKSVPDGGNGRKKYESPISDNCGKQNGECVYRCLEEFSESYGIKGGNFDYWCSLASKVLGRETINEDGKVNGVDVWELDGLINNSDYFLCKEIGTIIDSWCDAFDNDDRMMIIVPGHAAMIQSLTIDGDGYYTMRFAETSCDKRHVPYYSCNLTQDIPGCRIFKISLKP